MGILSWFKPDPNRKIDEQVLELVRAIMDHPAQTGGDPKYGVYQIKRYTGFTFETEYHLYIQGTMSEGLKIYDDEKCLVRGKWQETIVQDLKNVLAQLDRVAELKVEQAKRELQRRVKEAEAAYDMLKP